MTAKYYIRMISLRVRQIPKDVARERLRDAQIDYDNDRILIRPKPPPPPPPAPPIPTLPPTYRPPISALPLAYEIPGTDDVRGNEISGLLQFEESRNRGVGATGGKRRPLTRRRIHKRRKGKTTRRLYFSFISSILGKVCRAVCNGRHLCHRR